MLAHEVDVAYSAVKSVSRPGTVRAARLIRMTLDGRSFMDVKAQLQCCPGIWRARPPAVGAALIKLESGAGFPLPLEYLSFLLFSNGGEGDLAIEPGWVSFWPAERILEYNTSYKLAEFAPGFFGFGSNGGGELLAFDTRTGPPYPVS